MRQAGQPLRQADIQGETARWAASGTPVYAAASGRVADVGGLRCINTNLGGSCEDWGFLGIDHGNNNIITQYGHLSRYCVLAGEQVERGQLIGYSGSKAPAGRSVAAHLHFEVWRWGSAEDPVPLLGGFPPSR